METHLAPFLQNTPQGDTAQAILRKCVHCGICTATCPTYQLLGDELDGPRGRIYLIKQVVEGKPATRKTQLHLDRCLTCRSCETTCPSGVEYGQLLDIGRELVDRQVYRPIGQRITFSVLRQVIPSPKLFSIALSIARIARPLLPSKVQEKIPKRAVVTDWPQTQHQRKILLLDGCAQPSLTPNINRATARVLDVLGIQSVLAPKGSCCGSVRFHLDDQRGALNEMRRNIDAWWPYVENGIEAIIMTASGCGVMVKDYARLLRHDHYYVEKAKKISALCKDISEFLPTYSAELSKRVSLREHGEEQERITWHSPCTLQHGQQIFGEVETLLRQLDIEVSNCANSHLCCGSAGTYSILQPELSRQLRDNKLNELMTNKPTAILSANVGCITHLQSGTQTPVMHWVELVDSRIS